MRGTWPPKVLSSDGTWSKRLPKGLYDEGILCQACDSALGKWDQHAWEALAPPPPPGTQQHYRLRSEYPKLKLFFVSLLWRAHHSPKEFFGHVRLNIEQETRAREMLLTEDPGEPQDFGVALGRYEDELAQGTISQPDMIRAEGINCYRFSLGAVAAVVKVDTRPFNSALLPFVLAPDRPLLVALFEFRSSRLYLDVVDLFRARARPREPCRSPTR